MFTLFNQACANDDMRSSKPLMIILYFLYCCDIFYFRILLQPLYNSLTRRQNPRIIPVLQITMSPPCHVIVLCYHNNSSTRRQNPRIIPVLQITMSPPCHLIVLCYHNNRSTRRQHPESHHRSTCHHLAIPLI